MLTPQEALEQSKEELREWIRSKKQQTIEILTVQSKMNYEKFFDVPIHSESLPRKANVASARQKQKKQTSNVTLAHQCTNKFRGVSKPHTLTTG
jgi:hypothetical protein